MKKSILIVEDDEHIRQSLVDVLEDEGHQVLSACNGQEGLEVLRRPGPPPGLVILDIMMPVLDGQGLLREKMSDPRIADVPTVLLSATGRLPQVAETPGVAGLLKKPVSLDALLEVVSEFCPS